MRSCAKINLGLRVLGRRIDGYHDLESIFVGVDLYDTLSTVEPSDQLIVECSPPVTESVEDNLVYKAANALLDVLGPQERMAKITLKKTIPTGSGLGGGSSNAAYALMALYQFWTGGSPYTGAARTILRPVAEMLGSDVTFFLYDGVAYVKGRGEIIIPMQIDLPWSILIVIPDKHISTTHAYSTLGITENKTTIGLNGLMYEVVENTGLLDEYFTNDFQAVMAKEVPDISTISDKLREEGAFFSSLSGSGSAVFGLFTSVEKAEAAQKAFEGKDTFVCRPIPPLEDQQ